MKELEFKECEKCSKKSDTPETILSKLTCSSLELKPVLCDTCKINSFTIHTLKRHNQSLELMCANLRRELNAFRRKSNYVPILAPGSCVEDEL